MICIYEANERDWHGNGLCILQPSSCTVSEIAGGDFSLTLVHPITEDLRWKELQEERIIKFRDFAYQIDFPMFHNDCAIHVMCSEHSFMLFTEDSLD